jgi:hypothetical protein
MPPGSPETVQRCTTSPLFATATAGYSALHLMMRDMYGETVGDVR